MDKLARGRGGLEDPCFHVQLSRYVRQLAVTDPVIHEKLLLFP